MRGRDEELNDGTHLQGLHLLRLSMAVNWIAADHVLLGCVSRLNVDSSNLITPLPAAASFTSLSCSGSRAAETRVKGRRRRARIGVHNILGLDVLNEIYATCLMHKKGNTEDSHPDLLGRKHSSSDDHGDGHTTAKL